MHSSTPAYCPNCGSTRGNYARSGKCTDCGVAWDSGLGVMGGTFSADVAYTPADPGNLSQAWLDKIRNHSPLLTPYYNAAQALLSAPTKTTALVTAFQNAFNASSVYKLPVTGVYDSATENAMGDYYQYLADVAAEALQNAAVKTSALVTAFQKAHNLTVNSSYQVPVRESTTRPPRARSTARRTTRRRCRLGSSRPRSPASGRKESRSICWAVGGSCCSECLSASSAGFSSTR